MGITGRNRPQRDGIADLLQRARIAPLPEPHRLASILHVASGLVVVLLVPIAPELRYRTGVAVTAVAAVVLGVVISCLPWHRWPANASRWLIPESLGLVALFNVTAAEPYVFSLFYFVVWLWVGITQRPGVGLAFAPVLIVAYVAPALTMPDGARVWVSALYVVPVCIVCSETLAFVAERMRRSEATVARSEARYASLVRHASEFVTIIGPDRLVNYASPAVERVIGWRPEDLIGNRAGDFVHPSDRDFVRTWFRGAMGAVAGMPFEFRLLHADGTWRWIEGTVTNLLDDDVVGGVVMNGRDISERKAAQEALERSAYTDALTGLGNRAALLHALSGAQGHTALLFLDLDGFKFVNDSLGHVVGDQLLVSVTARLRRFISGPDLFRIGGDEFVVLLGGSPDEQAVASHADAVVASFGSPFVVAERELSVNASVGVAMVDTELSAVEALRRADLAMYRAKQEGGARWAVYDDELARRARNRLETEAELRVGLERGEFFLEFQPEVELVSGRVVAVEALVRWMHPERGRVGPDAFISIAEESGLIVPLGRWVLAESIERARIWAQAGFDLTVSVNVSAHQLRGMRLVGEVAAMLAAAGLAPERLRLEITESDLMSPEVQQVVIPALREIGVQVAIDDFGTGYSSLAYLQQLAVDTLKIDKSFLEPLAGEGRAPLISAIVAMAHNLALRVVAEGVETPAQLDLLRHLNCDRVQGFLFARPLSEGDLLRFLLSPPAHLAPSEGQPRLRSVELPARVAT